MRRARYYVQNMGYWHVIMDRDTGKEVSHLYDLGGDAHYDCRQKNNDLRNERRRAKRAEQKTARGQS